MATSGPGRHQPGDADRRRLHGLGADGRDHRPGRPRRSSAPTPSRRPTSPASRCRSPSTTSSCSRPRTSRRRSPRRSTSPRPAAPARCSSTCRRTCCRSATTFTLAAAHRPARLPPGHPAARQADPRGRAADRRRRAGPVLYVGGGVLKAPRHRRAAPAGRAHRHPGRHHADGARRVPRQPPPAPRHARHARLGLGGHRAAEGRPAHRARHPLRRPGHRPARHLRARTPRSSTPTSTRPRSARTGSPTCRSSATCARCCSSWCPALQAEFDADHRADLTGWWRQIDQWRETYPLGYDEPPDGTLAPQYVIERLGADRRAGDDLRRRRRAAPDVGRAVHQVREPLHLAELRRRRDDGLLGAGGDGRQGRAARTSWCGPSTATAASR